MRKNKKILIVLVILAIVIISLVLMKKDNKHQEQVESTNPLDIIQVFELEDNTKYQIQKTKDIQICSKYLTGIESYKLNANVKFEDSIGKMYYVREEYSNLNIYQTEYEIDKYEATTSQVEGIILNFEDKCKRFLGVDYEEKGMEELRGKSTTKGKIPVAESIYDENREYIKTYKVEEKIYEMCFYRKENKIICELVYEL